MGLKEPGVLILATVLVLTIVQAAGQSERRTGNTCTTDAECPDNAWCRPGTAAKGYCVCKDGYIIEPYNSTHRECLKEAQAIGDFCTSDMQCQSKMLLASQCSGGVCRCKAGSHIDSGRCYETANVGDKCIVSQNCYIGDDGRPETQAFCVRGECTCTLLHSPRDNGTRCVKDSELGEMCEDDEQCVSGGLMCAQGVCRCKENFAPHTLDPRCVPVTLELGGACEVETQCRTLGMAAICENGACVCAWGTREVADKCWNIRITGEECTNSYECVTEQGGNGTCVQGACSVRPALPPPPAPPGSGVEHQKAGLITAILAIVLSLLSLYKV